MFGPGNIDENFQALCGSEIQKPGWRDVIDANQVGSEFDDLSEIPGSLVWGGKHFAVGIRREWTIGNSFDVELAVIDSKEFAFHGRATRRMRSVIDHASKISFRRRVPERGRRVVRRVSRVRCSH
jgi:hypothetical protein